MGVESNIRTLDSGFVLSFQFSSSCNMLAVLLFRLLLLHDIYNVSEDMKGYWVKSQISLPWESKLEQKSLTNFNSTNLNSPSVFGEMMRLVYSCVQCWCWCEINSTSGGESQLSNSTIPIVPRLTKYNIIQTWRPDYLDFTLYCAGYTCYSISFLMIENI